MPETWVEGAGADEVPVLSHVFVADPERCCVGHFRPDPVTYQGSDECAKCSRCRQWVRPTEINNRCPARAGQDRGRLQ